MQIVSKVLAASGLVILTGPLCFMAQAQGYVDVEAERAAAAAAGSDASNAAADPYGVQPAKAYPATSYGVSSGAAAAPATSSTAPVAPLPSSSQNLGSLFLQLQQLQQEVMHLNGKVEEQAHELRTLKEQSLQRYVDVDKRLGGGSGQPVASSGASGSSQTVSVAPRPAVPVAPVSSSAVEQPGEADAYRAAYALVQGRQFSLAANAFQQFQRDYPDGKYAANAYYWLGELYLVMDPPDLEASRQAFAMLISQYPDNSKAADALYKLGKVQYAKGNREKAKEYLDLVIRQYQTSNPAVAKLAGDFIAENY
jgi:tol-pal system protein YbgF